MNAEIHETLRNQVTHENSAFRPAGFWIRFLANLVDNVILFVLQIPFITVQYLSSNHDSKPAADSMDIESIKRTVGITALAWLFSTIIQYFYYAAFYQAKGATPGKQLLGIKVISTRSGHYLTYKETFVRELVGKPISGILLGIGFLMVAFRSDKKALHDLMAHTQVIETG
jgi:uncharacterized RDD family membrane protein YckC